MDASVIGVNTAIVPGQCRAGRALLDWTMEQLANSSSVPTRTILRFERANGSPRTSTLAAIRAALEAAGVEFIAENGGGAGVRLAKR